MFKCRQNDRVEVVLYSGQLYGSSEVPITLNGFMYDPQYAPPIAWAAYRTSGYSSPYDLNPVTYDTVLVNDGDAYANGYFTAPVRGAYFVHLGVGARRYKPIDYNLMVQRTNGARERVADIYRQATNYNGEDTLSRSLILELRAGEKLYVVSSGNSAFHSDPHKQTSFIGYILYKL